MASTTYLTDNDGKFIPATQRPDGTWRKARRVKEGYVPQEEVPLYESKGKQFAARKSGLPPGMCPQVADASRKDREKQERAKAKKQEKKSKQQQKQQQTAGVLVLPPASSSTETSSAKPTTAPKQNNIATTSAADVDSLSVQLSSTLKLDQDQDPQEIGKKLKKLRKKLREIEMIEEKIQTGELKKPEKDQVDKVKRKKEVLRDIRRLQEAEVAVNSRA